MCFNFKVLLTVIHFNIYHSKVLFNPTILDRLNLIDKWDLVFPLEALVVRMKCSFRKLCPNLLPLHNGLVQPYYFIACASI